MMLSTSIEYLGVFLAPNSTLQKEGNYNLQIKRLVEPNVRTQCEIFFMKNLLFLNALVVNYLQYSTLLLISMTDNSIIIVEKQDGNVSSRRYI